MLDPLELLLGVGGAALVAFAADRFLRWLSEAKHSSDLSAALGYIAGHFLLAVRSETAAQVALGHSAGSSWTRGLSAALRQLTRPHVAHDWIPLLLIAGIVLALVLPRSHSAAASASIRLRDRAGPTLWLILALLVPLRLLWGSIYLPHDSWTWAHLAGYAALGIPLWLPTLVDRSPVGHSQREARIQTGVLGIVLVAEAITLFCTGSKVYGMLGLTAAGAISASKLVGAFPSQRREDTAAPHLCLMLCGALLMLGYFFAELPALSGVLLFAAIASTLVGNWARASARQSVLTWGLAGLLALGVMGHATWKFAAAVSGPAANPYESFEP